MKSLRESLHVENYMFYSATAEAGKGKEALTVRGPKLIRAIWCHYYIGAKLLLFLHNRQWKTFAL